MHNNDAIQKVSQQKEAAKDPASSVAFRKTAVWEPKSSSTPPNEREGVDSTTGHPPVGECHIHAEAVAVKATRTESRLDASIVDRDSAQNRPLGHRFFLSIVI
ncbi:hypothetical protein L596_004392 [Steinernema carpocapsae]|uniref:Uncharacterized protein n=1 Tax=Steinernema carpocapsae TaxID=34508 RepID=A0A4U8UZS6_STECR|nr:hypothetical protein L596_004392 [Steinernema carpocapsae]